MIPKTISYVILLGLCFMVQVSIQAPFPQSVITQMADRTYRYHHYLWHNIRDNWNFFTASTRSQLTSIGWNCPRPSRKLDSDGNLVVLTENKSGEDFLYMHMQMVNKVNSIIASTNDPYGQIVGWTSVPAPGDANYPVPPNYEARDEDTTAAVDYFKSDDFYEENILDMEDTFKDPTQLKGMTLGQFGSIMEVTIHNWMHLRFSANSTLGYRPLATTAIPVVDTKWDDPQYMWLADTYASHVNPVFWKIHGWVLDRLNDWKAANKVTTIKWVGTWTGGPMGNISVANSSSRRLTATTDNLGDTIQKVLKILSKDKSVKESSFADRLFIENWEPRHKQRSDEGDDNSTEL